MLFTVSDSLRTHHHIAVLQPWFSSLPTSRVCQLPCLHQTCPFLSKSASLSPPSTISTTSPCHLVFLRLLDFQHEQHIIFHLFVLSSPPSINIVVILMLHSPPFLTLLSSTFARVHLPNSQAWLSLQYPLPLWKFHQRSSKSGLLTNVPFVLFTRPFS